MAYVRASVLLVFVVWRCADSIWMLLVDRSRVAAISFEVPGRDERLRNGLLMKSPGRPNDIAFRHLQLVWGQVPHAANLYYLDDFAGAPSLTVIQRFLRIRWLIYPTYIQPIETLPLPDSSRRPPLAGKPTYVLDVRLQQPADLGGGFEKVDERDGAVLWRLLGPGSRGR